MSMRISDYMLLAMKNIFHQRSRSLLAILAIVIGATSVTIMLALVMGAKEFYYGQFKATGQLEQLIVNPQTGLDFVQSQRAANCENCVKLTNELAEEIKSYGHVVGISATADVNIFEKVALGDKEQVVNGARGYLPNGVIKHLFVAGGDFNDDSGSGEVIVGQNYADQWGYEGNYKALIGQEVELTTSSSFTGKGAELPNPLVQFKQCQDGCKAEEIAAQQEPTTLEATIVGIESDDSNGLFLPLSWAEELLTSQRYEITKQNQSEYVQTYDIWSADGQQGVAPTPKFTLVKDNQLAKDGYSTFVVKADSPDNVDALAEQIKGLGVGVATAKSYINDQLKIFNIISFILAGIGSIALFVAAIGVINTMVMAVLERTREIGVMRAVGAKRATVRRLFTFEASLLGFIGGVCGIVLGFGLIQLANIFINIQLAENGVASRNIITLPLWLILTVVAATTVIGMLAGLYPAHRAANMDPVEALRHE